MRHDQATTTDARDDPDFPNGITRDSFQIKKEEFALDNHGREAKFGEMTLGQFLDIKRFGRDEFVYRDPELVVPFNFSDVEFVSVTADRFRLFENDPRPKRDDDQYHYWRRRRENQAS